MWKYKCKCRGAGADVGTRAGVDASADMYIPFTLLGTTIDFDDLWIYGYVRFICIRWLVVSINEKIRYSEGAKEALVSLAK